MPLVADFFADADTQADRSCLPQARRHLKRGMQWKTLAPALEALAEAAPSPLLGVVYGAGFEDRPELLDARSPNAGRCSATTQSAVERVKAPGAVLRRARPPRHSASREPSPTLPRQGDGWLAKRQGGAGGSHIVAGNAGCRRQTTRPHSTTRSRSRGARSRPCSPAPGIALSVLGFSEQWAAPTPALRNGAMAARCGLPSFRRSWRRV